MPARPNALRDALRRTALLEAIERTIELAVPDTQHTAAVLVFVDEWGWALPHGTDWTEPSGLPERPVGESAPAYLDRVARAVLTAAQNTPKGTRLTEDDLPVPSTTPLDPRRVSQAETWLRSQTPDPQSPARVRHVARIFQDMAERGHKGQPVILNSIVQALALTGIAPDRAWQTAIRGRTHVDRFLEGAAATHLVEHWLEEGTGTLQGKASRAETTGVPRAEMTAWFAANSYWRGKFGNPRHATGDTAVLGHVLRYPDRIDREGRALFWATYHKAYWAQMAARHAGKPIGGGRSIGGWIPWFASVRTALRGQGPEFGHLVADTMASDPDAVIELLRQAPTAQLRGMEAADIATLLSRASGPSRETLMTMLDRVTIARPRRR